MIQIPRKLMFGVCMLLTAFQLSAADPVLNINAETGGDSRIDR